MVKKKILSTLIIAALSITSFNCSNSIKAQMNNNDTVLNNPIINNESTTWDCVYFGNYWQNDTNGDGKTDRNDKKQPIKWRVLSVDGDDAFLIADKNLDAQPYNKTTNNGTWETSTLRTWLNSTFLNNAFSESEQKAINCTNISNENNPFCMTEGGNDTTDSIYLLSISEASNPMYGFNDEFRFADKARTSENTDYAVTCGAYSYDGQGDFWLRTPGETNKDETSVLNTGYGDYTGLTTYYKKAVRPVLHLNISSSLWKFAGKICLQKKNNVSLYNLNYPTMCNGVITWDCVYFGNYWQNDTNGDGTVNKNDKKQPIKWRVLSVEGDDAFLLADKNLDHQRYNKNYGTTTWEKCSLRSWLNSTFLKSAFSSSEINAIKYSTVTNDNNPYYSSSKGGNTTVDKIYLLSINEASNPFLDLTLNMMNQQKQEKQQILVIFLHI